MVADFRGKAVLVTGGTRGVGLAAGLAFGRRGATSWLTYRWGSVPEDEVQARFVQAGAPPPHLVRADVGMPEDVEPLLDQLAAEHDGVEVLVSNVTNTVVVESLAQSGLRGLEKTLEYSAWPVVTYLLAIKQRLGRYPRYVLGVSSTGADAYARGYDFVAASKSALESLVRHLARHLASENVRVNVVRSGFVPSESMEEVFGVDFLPFVRRFSSERHFASQDEIGEAMVGLCSGLMDAVSGQVITVDRGVAFLDNLMHLYDRREALRL